MIRSLWTAKTGLEAQQFNVDVISNNLANVSTNGFKRQRAVFARICAALVDARGERFERGLVVRRYVPLAPAGGDAGERDEHRLFFWRGRLIARRRT